MGFATGDAGAAGDVQQGRRPESVLVVVHTAALSVLLLRRVSPPDFWQSVTGSMHWGERAHEAAVREVHEETGIACTAADLVATGVTREFEIRGDWRARFAPGTRVNREHRFYLPLRRPCPVRLAPDEHVESAWVPAAEAAARASSWTNREAIERLLATGGRE